MKLNVFEETVLIYAKRENQRTITAGNFGWRIDFFSSIARELEKKGLISNCQRLDQNNLILAFDIRERALTLV